VIRETASIKKITQCQVPAVREEPANSVQS